MSEKANTTRVSEPPVCDVCDRRVKSTAIRMIMSDKAHACDDCFRQWYDPDYVSITGKDGRVDPELIKKNVMTKYGPYKGEGIFWPETRRMMVDGDLYA